MKVTNVVEALKKFGLSVMAYKKPPSGTKDSFVISIAPKGPEGTLQINQGNAQVEVFGSKKERQAVLSVVEPPRRFERSLKAIIHAPMDRSNPAAIRYREPKKDEMEDALRSQFGLNIPSGAEFSYKNVKFVERKTKGVSGTRPIYGVSGMVIATVGKRTTNNFLVGVDESHNFVAPLPKKVTSVREAHAILKPKGLRPNTIRQGEWFFEPCTKEESAEFDKLVTAARVKESVLGQSTHIAKSTIRVSNVLYARGFVVDRRNGRHVSIFLDRWHKVVRNKEIPMPRRPKHEPVSRRRSSWD